MRPDAVIWRTRVCRKHAPKLAQLISLFAHLRAKTPEGQESLAQFFSGLVIVFLDQALEMALTDSLDVVDTNVKVQGPEFEAFT